MRSKQWRWVREGVLLLLRVRVLVSIVMLGVHSVFVVALAEAFSTRLVTTETT